MILFIILLVMIVVLALAAILTIGTIGAGAILLFGDVFVCIAIIAWIMWIILKKK